MVEERMGSQSWPEFLPGDPHAVHDARFRKLIFGHTRLEKLWTGARWAEGPAYFAAGRYLVFSDIPNDRLLRYDETDGGVSVFRQPCFNENGHTVDREGRLISCEHRGRCVSRTEHDGRRTVLAAAFEGKPLNSPNDAVVKSDGTVWFTDPTYGIDSHYEGDAGESAIGASHVYRLDPRNGALSVVADDLVKPNGLAFSPDESLLYVVDTGMTHDPSCTPKIRVYPVAADGAKLGAGRLFSECDAGLYDGLRVDEQGHVWTSAGDGVHVIHPDGALLGKIPVPELVANVCFGGPKRNRLYICGQTSLYSLYVNAQGIPYRRGADPE
jgi:gluconolactonase